MSDSTISDDEREALVTIAHGAVVTSGGVSVHRILTTATELVLTRGLGPVSYGVYALAWRIAQLLVRLVTFGSMPTLQRYIPGGDRGQRSRVAGLAYATTLVFGAAFAVCLWLLAPTINAATLDQPSFPPTLRLFGFLVGLIGLVIVTAGIFRATGSARGEVLFNKLLRPAARLTGASLALALGYSVVGVAGVMVLATATLAVVGVPYSIRSTGIVPTVRGLRSEAVLQPRGTGRDEQHRDGVPEPDRPVAGRSVADSSRGGRVQRRARPPLDCVDSTRGVQSTPAACLVALRVLGVDPRDRFVVSTLARRYREDLARAVPR